MISAGEETKALRQWRFSDAEEIDEKLILDYVNEAIENEKLGKRWKAEKSAVPEMPKIMKDFFQKENLKQAFLDFTPYKQKEFIEHIATAKREATQISRLEKIKPMIMEGKGLYDKYK